ncbi:hypothetical protein JZ751_018911 [Albula glossodonta]|nr:hypothetical protein JZ751_018911 [Albula glossodonta]
MYVNSPATENVSLSLTFLGKKIRNCSVAPALKQRAWETTALPSDSGVSMETGRACRGLASTVFPEELPGSVPDLREEVQRSRPCPVHNTRLDQDAAPGKPLSTTRVRGHTCGLPNCTYGKPPS